MAVATFTAGALRAKSMRVTLMQLELPFSEVSGFLETTFIVYLRTAQHRINAEMVRHWIIREQREAQWEAFAAKRAELKKINAKKLKKVNFWRRVTFRKPLDRLPLALTAY